MSLSKKYVDIIQTTVLIVVVALSWGFVIYAGREAAVRQYPEFQQQPQDVG